MLQTAHTLDRGQTAISIGAGYIHDPREDDAPYGVPVPEIGIRHGFTSNMDAGLHYTLTGVFGDLKYALYQNRAGGAFSVTGGGGYMWLGNDSCIWAVAGGVIAGYRITSKFTPHLALRFGKLVIKDNDEQVLSFACKTYIYETVAGMDYRFLENISILSELSIIYAPELNHPVLGTIRLGGRVYL